MREAAREFVGKEDRLDVLFNNGGVASVPAHMKTRQELKHHIRVNSVVHIPL